MMLTGPAFYLTIDPVLKHIESEFERVHIRAIQDDITLVGTPHIIFGTDGALEALLPHASRSISGRLDTSSGGDCRDVRKQSAPF